MTAMAATAIGLIHEFDYSMTVSPPYDVGDGPYGRRQYVEVTSAEVDGGRLKGTLLGSAGDWMLLGADGFMRMDVRLQLRTDDGAVICVHYFGPAEANDRLQRAMAASAPTDFPDQRIRTHWLVETGDTRYGWVNQAVFVGEGRFRPGDAGVAGFEHRVYRIDRLSERDVASSP